MLSPFTEGHPCLCAKEASEGPLALVQAFGPLVREHCDARCVQEVNTKRVKSGVSRQRCKEGQHGRAGDFMQRESHYRRVASPKRIRRLNVNGFEQQGLEKRRNHQNLATSTWPWRCTRFDVQASRAHADHANAMRLSCRYPHATVRRHNPSAVIGSNFHQSSRTVQKLRATVMVSLQECPGSVVVADGKHLSGKPIDCFDGSISHCVEMLAEIQILLSSLRMQAIQSVDNLHGHLLFFESD